MKTNRGTTAAIVAGALLMSLLAVVPTAAAKVVYTPVNMTLSVQVSIDAHYDHRGNWMRTTLVDVAYERIHDQAIKTGQTSGDFDDAPSTP